MLLAVRILSAAALILLGPLANENPRAEPPPPPVTWLDIGGVDPVPLEQPSALLTALAEQPDRRYLEILGEAAFAAPEILGTLARRSGP